MLDHMLGNVYLVIILSLLPLLQAKIVTHHCVSQTLNFLEMFFLVVFRDKKVSRIPESYVGICGSWAVQALNSHVTISVFSVTETKSVAKP
jgi:hypothetical protein